MSNTVSLFIYQTDRETIVERETQSRLPGLKYLILSNPQNINKKYDMELV